MKAYGAARAKMRAVVRPPPSPAGRQGGPRGTVARYLGVGRADGGNRLAQLRGAPQGSPRRVRTGPGRPGPERLGLLPLVLIPMQRRAEPPREAPVTWLGG